ncbi:MAG TPA: GGDEF domain-containing protein [Gaiellaceae bacterium]|nr:GGDEF domain-containing protein [Gaiellaceae bacterium]
MLLIALAILVSLVTLALLFSLLRALRVHESRPPVTRTRHERRQAHPAARDAREAIALVGDALAATHNPRALVPLILEVVTEATGARGAQMLHEGEEVGWFGEAGGRTRPLTLDLASEDSETDTKLLLYPHGRGFDAETRKLAEWVAAQAGIALENARLHEEVRRQATTDELTNLVNRRRFIEALETELERAKMFGSPLSVVLADLDDFKRINDEYGHHAGDRALTAFGQLLRDHVRDFDVAARLGGEEFAILLPQTTAAAAAIVAARMRDALAGSSIEVSEDASVQLTASFGIAESNPDQTTDELLRRADDALYAAKRGGKNRYVIDATPTSRKAS